ncbi:hypothetical protein [Nostoc sp. ATCC 53789]|uniref:hypothetical protein n=1 Tax=Nostoc sp. ATCC 53789 TaxID=76335 RepID=UPI0011BF219B|nr:hypothetical protein [Nostoc sp. ATCC 53789]QHG15752.1 hypothetical protein GJB62_07060 [Nostoc sp. ATCC 53789]
MTNESRIPDDTVGRGVWGVCGVRFLPHPPTPPTLLDFSLVRNQGNDSLCQLALIAPTDLS